MSYEALLRDQDINNLRYISKMNEYKFLKKIYLEDKMNFFKDIFRKKSTSSGLDNEIVLNNEDKLLKIAEAMGEIAFHLGGLEDSLKDEHDNEDLRNIRNKFELNYHKALLITNNISSKHSSFFFPANLSEISLVRKLVEIIEKYTSDER